jgi:hypothetical protein
MQNFKSDVRTYMGVYIVTVAAVDFFIKFGSEALRQHTQLWLQNEYMRSPQEQNRNRISNAILTE